MNPYSHCFCYNCLHYPNYIMHSDSHLPVVAHNPLIMKAPVEDDCKSIHSTTPENGSQFGDHPEENDDSSVSIAYSFSSSDLVTPSSASTPKKNSKNDSERNGPRFVFRNFLKFFKENTRETLIQYLREIIPTDNNDIQEEIDHFVHEIKKLCNEYKSQQRVHFSRILHSIRSNGLIFNLMLAKIISILKRDLKNRKFMKIKTPDPYLSYLKKLEMRVFESL